MSSIGAVGGANVAFALQASLAAAHATKPVDRDGDQGNKQPDQPVAPVKVGTTPINKLDVMA